MESDIIEVPNENENESAPEAEISPEVEAAQAAVTSMEVEAEQDGESSDEGDSPDDGDTSDEVESSPEAEGAIKQKTHFTGTVTRVGLAGVLVDIGAEKPGLMHISQIIAPTDEPIKRVEDVLKVGQSVDVWVKRVKDGRVELTMVRPLDLDWRDIKKGMTVKGKVVRLEKFGAFVEIGAERPGLIHISEMAHGYVRQPTDVVNEGDDVEAQVIDVNRKKRQIKLSIKALLPEPVKEEEPVQEFVDNNNLIRREKSVRPKKVRKASRGRDNESGGDVDELMAALGHSEGQSDAETAMAIAWKEAMDKAKARKQDDKSRKNRGATAEQEDILSRTLEHKVQTTA
jgi:small subunit ribosomal protein S1